MQIFLKILQFAPKIPAAINIGKIAVSVFKSIRTYLAAKKKIQEAKSGNH